MISYRHSGEARTSAHIKGRKTSGDEAPIAGRSLTRDALTKVPKTEAPLSVCQVDILSQWTSYSTLEPDQHGRAKVRVDIRRKIAILPL